MAGQERDDRSDAQLLQAQRGLERHQRPHAVSQQGDAGTVGGPGTAPQRRDDTVGQAVHIADARLAQPVEAAGVLHRRQLDRGREPTAPGTEERRRAARVRKRQQAGTGEGARMGALQPRAAGVALAVA
jgi:hypothetical protein